MTLLRGRRALQIAMASAAVAFSGTWVAGQLPLQQRTYATHVSARKRVHRNLYLRLARVRSEPSAQSSRGAQLVQLSLPAEREVVLWQCAQECWSPVPRTDGSVAVLTPGGIWRVRAGESPTLAVPGEFAMLLEELDDRRILGIVPSTRQGCAAELRAVDLERHTVSVPDSIASCVDSAQAILPAVRFRADPSGTRVLATTLRPPERPLEPRSIKVSRAFSAADTLFDQAGFEDLSPRLVAALDWVDRFDPAWVDDRTVIYITRRLR